MEFLYRSWFKVVAPAKPLADTTINDILYKRAQFVIQGWNNSTLPMIGYLRCDKNGTMFQFDKKISKQFRCPLVRIDFLPTPENAIPTSTEVVFIRNNLTKEELKVFEAWERNSRKHPVSKN